ncbi:HNH endonuclease [Bacillus subtilis]|uniref:HNH endonuclease n=1 Tax=Bacillus subtilis TaxID=1423 RepID=UPI00125E520A|nr:HNH endonuclease [Bacillus subtilis]QFP71406.1 HNH endonuclease [Bacillus subtilis]QGM16329.1 hypothetical protein GI368_07885 [Bacillus subtilis]
MKCIMCKRDKENLSEEHVFPDAIGGTLVLFNVCKDCNDILGHSVDHHLTNHWLIQYQRSLLKIPGKSGTIPSPFKGGVIKKTEQKVRLTSDDEGRVKGYLMPSIKKEKNSDNTFEIEAVFDKQDKEKIPKMMDKILKRQGLGATYSEIDKKIIEGNLLEPININIELDQVKYKKAIMKIVYELAHYWLGENYFNDPIGEKIRKYIKSNDFSDDIAGSIGLFRKEEKKLLNLWEDEPLYHMAFMQKSGKNIIIYIKIFNVFDGSVILSNNADCYHDFEPKFISINPVTGIKRESNIYEEIVRRRKKNERD